MASFTEFFSTFDGDTNLRGKQFERFVKWFLKSDPEWATQVEAVWLWDEYPGRWGPDCGIDLVFRSKIGKTWAVQAKCYSADYDISKNDVDTFLSESNRKQIDHRLPIATTDRIGANARQVLDAQEKSVVRYLLSHFESAAVEFPDSIQSLSSGKRKSPPELDRPHQIEAVDAVLSGFQTASRGQLIMACGTGKTFVCLWVKERLKAKRTLVLVPSLGLLSQILNEWTFAAREPFDALCVCSDQTVNRRDDDEAISQTADIPFPVSNDVNEIAGFLKGDRDQVIFSTYQSSPLIAQAQKHTEASRFDLVIADEAHRCAGKSDTVFGTVLDDQLIGFFLPVRVLSRLFRRLFLERLLAAYQANRLKFFGDHAALADAQAFAAYLAPLRRAEWVVYAKRPFGGPQAVLAYLSRYTHRVAIANSRLIACDRTGVSFRWKDYRTDGRDRQKVMTLATGEFIRRFLIHVLPQGFHRIRHYGLLASGTRAHNIARARRLLDASPAQPKTADTTTSSETSEPNPLSHPCPCCGGRMVIIETFQRGSQPRYRPAVIRIDTS
jgi:hypothetical protein